MAKIIEGSSAAKNTTPEVRVVEVERATEAPEKEKADNRHQDEYRHSYQAVFQGALDAILISDDAGRYIDANPAAVELFGVARDRLIGMHPWDFAPPEMADQVQEWWRSFLERGKLEGEFSLQRPDGQIRYLEYRARASFLPGRHLSVLRDVTERKTSQEALEAREHLLRRVTDEVPVYIAYCDRQLQYRFVNRRYANWFGLSPEEVVGKHVSEILGEAAYAAIRPRLEAALSGNPVHVETSLPSASLGLRQIMIDYMPDMDEQGEVQAVVAVMQDLTEYRAAQEGLAQSREQLRALAVRREDTLEEERTRISREIHDQLGQALTGFKLDVAWLGRRLTPLLPAGPGAAAISEKLAAMSDVTDSIIDAVRAISWELRPPVLDDLGLEAAIEWQAEEFQKRSGIHTAFTADPREREPSTDRATAVFRILQEALINVARHAAATRVDIFLSSEEGNLILEVRDNGRGISQEPEGEEASPFRSLGLLGMRERASALGGTLDIRSPADKGTRLLLRLPVSNGFTGSSAG